MLKKPLLLSAACSISLLVAVSFLFGFYYETYEHFHNYIIKGTASTKTIFDPIMNNDFGLFQLFMIVQKQFPTIEVYAWARLFFLFLASWALFFFIITFFKNDVVRITLLIAVSISLIENFIFINTNRSAFLLGFSGFLMLILYDAYNKRAYLASFYILSVLAILNRIENAAVLCGLGLLFCLLSYQKKKVIHVGIVLIISIITSASFYLINFLNFDYAYIFINNERKITRQNNFILDFEELTNIVSGTDSTTDKEKLKICGNAFFILDEPTLDVHEVPKLIKYPNPIDYYFHNPNLKKTYIANLQQTITSISHYRWFCLLFAALVIACFTYFIRFKKNIGRPLLFLLLLVLVPVGISLFISLEDRFFSPYLSCVLLLVLFLLNHFLWKISFKKHLVVVNLLVIGVGILHFTSYTWNELKLKKSNEEISKVLHESFNKDVKEGITPILLSLLSWNAIPSKLFASQNSKQPDYYFLILGPYDYSSYYRKEKETLFGEKYYSITNRLDYIIEENKGVLYGTELGGNFIKRYMRYVHNYYIDFELMDSFDEVQKDYGMFGIHKYKITHWIPGSISCL